MLNGISYVLSTGCQRNALPTDLTPKSTVYDYLDLWDWDVTLERIHHALYLAVREQAGREASPTVAINEVVRAFSSRSQGGGEWFGGAKFTYQYPTIQCLRSRSALSNIAQMSAHALCGSRSVVHAGGANNTGFDAEPTSGSVIIVPP